MMVHDRGSTAQRLIDEAKLLIVGRGYNGFSYADLATAVGIRKPSIHFHFPTKAALACAVVEQARLGFEHQAARLTEGSPDAAQHLHAYTDYWKQCIRDGSAPFCLAAVLAAEMPALPPDVALEVRRHFDVLLAWLTSVMELGQNQKMFTLARSPAQEADSFMAAVYGAMLAARAFDDPDKFTAITDALFERLSGP